MVRSMMEWFATASAHMAPTDVRMKSIAARTMSIAKTACSNMAAVMATALATAKVAPHRWRHVRALVALAQRHTMVFRANIAAGRVGTVNPALLLTTPTRSPGPCWIGCSPAGYHLRAKRGYSGPCFWRFHERFHDRPGVTFGCFMPRFTFCETVLSFYGHLPYVLCIP